MAMRHLNGMLGLVLAGLSVARLSDGALWCALYGVGAVVALASLKRGLHDRVVWLLAITATGAMFVFFGGFIAQAPYVVAHWYEAEGAGGAIGLLVAAFLMMPVVADYSCRMHCKCRHAPSRAS